MKSVHPPDNLPDNCRAVLFNPPEGLEDSVNPIPGIVHLNEEGAPIAMEFMMQLSKDEIKVLRHEPFITITFMGDSLTPFGIQTSFPYEEKYDTLMEHQHVCTDILTHEKQKWWRCDNPSHDIDKQRIRMCDECWEKSANPEPVEAEETQ